MTTPKRWIDEQSDADDFERAILRSDFDAAPPAGADRDVLSRVMAAVAPMPPLGGGPSGPVGPATGGALGSGALAKGAATLGGLGKGFALGIGVSMAAVTGSHFLGGVSPWRETAPSTTVHAKAAESAAPAARPRLEAPLEVPETAPVEPAPRVAAPSEPAAPAVATAPAPAMAPAVGSAPGAPSVASFPATDEALAASRLKEEAALLRRARAELRAGSLAAAFATLEASRQKFTAPELAQEREALAIELLHRSGERAAAASRAREFLARYPGSPHAAAVRVFLGDAGR